MQKSLFTKYLRITSLIILVSFLCLGLVMIFVVSQYWQTEKRDLLSRNARSVAELAESTAFFDGTQYNLDGNRLQAFMTVFAESSDSEIFLTDRGGNRLVSSSVDSESPAQDAVVASAYMQPALSGGYIGLGTLGGIYQEAHYVVGVPISVEGLAGRDIVIGAVFAASNARLMDGYRRNIVKMFLFAGLVTFLVSFAVVWAFSYRMARPLREMAHAAREFGSGNFSVRVNASTDDEIGQLALAFNNMASSLATSENVRRNFIANVSHELKTPLAAIQNYGVMLREPGLDEKKRIEYAKAITDASRRLANLITNILKLNRLENQQIFPETREYNLAGQLCECLLGFEDEWEKKELEVETDIDEDIVINADEELLSLVWNNLFSNAVKFNRERGKITVRLRRDGEYAVAEVADTGCGISPDVGAHIFEKFYQGDTSHAAQGNGLGLALVKRVIDIVGGEITVNSAPNAGSTFSVRLKL